MKHTGRTMTLVALACIIAAGSAFAQLLPKKIWDLTVSVNVPNAAITVDNVQIQGNKTQVSGGAHNVKVHADGYTDFSGTVNVASNMTMTVRLSPAVYPLTIRVTPAGVGASVYVDNVDYTGKVAQVMAGSHDLLVSAPGYQDYSVSVDVAGPLAVDVALQPAGVLLTVNVNAANATVAVNNIVKGIAPYSEYLTPGTYTLLVYADGYADYQTRVSLDKAMTLNVVLKAVQPATLTFVIPAAFRDPDIRQGDAQGQVKIWIDNKLVNPRQELQNIPVTPGRHKIRISSGSFSMQVPDFIIQPGFNYVIDFAITVSVKASSNAQ